MDPDIEALDGAAFDDLESPVAAAPTAGIAVPTLVFFGLDARGNPSLAVPRA